MRKKKETQLTAASPIALSVLDEALESLYQRRNRSEFRRWDDDEIEDEDADCHYKNAEALHAMLLPAGSPIGFDKRAGSAAVKSDLRELLEHCLDGREDSGLDVNFAPGILLSSPETENGFVDFAALGLRLFSLAHTFPESVTTLKKTRIRELVVCTSEALLESAVGSGEGHAWAAVLLPKGSEPVGQPNAYFTSAAMLGLCDASNADSLLNSGTRKRCREAVLRGAYWLEGRFYGGRYYGDEERSQSSIVFFTHALHALLHCWEALDDKRRESCINMCKVYVQQVETEQRSLAPKITHTLAVGDYEGLQSYEDRTALGNVLAVLALIGLRCRSETGFPLQALSRQLNRVFSAIISDRSDATGLWSGEQLRIYATYRAIEALTLFIQHVRTEPLSLTDAEIVSAVGDALNSRTVRDAILASVLQKANEAAMRDQDLSPPGAGR
ncbi:MAG: hypothetical protein ACYTKD_15910 [Planctomycetota bacterium]